MVTLVDMPVISKLAMCMVVPPRAHWHQQRYHNNRAHIFFDFQPPMLRMYVFLQPKLQGLNITNGRRRNVMDEVKRAYLTKSNSVPH